MNKNEKTQLVVAGVVVTAATVRYLHIRKVERAKRAKIIADADARIEAIWQAAKSVNENIARGRYNNIDEAINDFDFHIIVNQYNED